MADPKILNEGGGRLSIANAHNEIYAFYTEKVAFWGKYEPIGGRLPPPPLPHLNPLLRQCPRFRIFFQFVGRAVAILSVQVRVYGDGGGREPADAAQ